jgi:hypothetical protein
MGHADGGFPCGPIVSNTDANSNTDSNTDANRNPNAAINIDT